MPLMTLRYKYQTVEFEEVDIHLRTLRNRQEFDDPNGEAERLGISSTNWSIFGTIWPSSMVLAHHLFRKPLQGKRILEVGCGIGLPSILMNHMKMQVTATDYHPEVGHFLDVNSELNKDSKIPFIRTEWTNLETTMGTFDIIVGSDLLYEDQHVNQLSVFINQHAKPACEVVVVDPGRGRKTKFMKNLESCGFISSEVSTISGHGLDRPFKGHILTLTRDG